MTETNLKARLDALIAAERSALLAGDFERIGQLIGEKRGLAADLADLSDARDVPRMQRAALERNQELFERTLEGLRAVADRIGMLAHTRATLETYDAQGRRHSIKRIVPPSVERRA